MLTGIVSSPHPSRTLETYTGARSVVVIVAVMPPVVPIGIRRIGMLRNHHIGIAVRIDNHGRRGVHHRRRGWGWRVDHSRRRLHDHGSRAESMLEYRLAGEELIEHGKGP